MITVDDAWQRIATAMPRARTERRAVTECGGAILAEAVRAERDQPPFDRVMMDGIAVAGDDGHRRRWAIQGTQAAGAATLALGGASHCIEVMTGAALPAGADTVIPVERLRVSAGHAELREDASYTCGQFVHARGSDYREGAALLAPGTQIGAPEMAVLASSGHGAVRVASAPGIALYAVGDELVDPGSPVGPSQIRRSNDLAIATLLAQRGYRPALSPVLPDDPDALHRALDAGLASHDVLVLTGGVSMGKFDYIPAVLDQLGVRIVFHKVAQKPGRPMWFGRRGQTVVFALPGNPVSALVCARRYVVPALEHAAGFVEREETVAVTSMPTPPTGLTAFVPVVVGTAPAQPRPPNTSGDFHALAGTTGFVEVPPGSSAKEPLRLWRW